jgi:Carboxypeptidase regulatory-like domain
MRSRIFSLMVLGCAIVCWSNGACAQALARSTLSGRITNPPRAGLSVKLKSIENNPLAIYDGYSAQTLADGDFQFQDVEPGRYVLVAEAAGFMATEYGAEGPDQTGTPIELKAGQLRKGIVLSLAPKRVVCGKVTDDHGNPLPKVEVYAFRHFKGSMWLMSGDYIATDEAGSYRLPDLEPGEYFLEAGMSTWFIGSKNLTQIEAESLANAESVEVGRADGAGCRENIRMGPRVGYRSFKIRGKIAEDPALVGKDLVLSFLEVSRTGVARAAPFPETFDPGPSFDLSAPPAGHYRLILSHGRFPPNGYAGQPEFTILSSQEITLAGADVNGITVAPDPMGSLSGRVKLEGIAAAAACPTKEKTHLRIQKEDDGQFQNVEVAADGTFSFAHVPLGTYTVDLYPFIRGSVYVKTMLFDGQPVDGRRITISSVTSHSLEVVLSGDAAHASGHSTPGETVARYRAEGTHPKASVSGKVTDVQTDSPWVKLWAVRFNSDRSYEYSTKPGPDGSFHFENVDPGIYLLVTQGSAYTLSEYGASYPRLEGRTITLRAGQRLAGLTLSAAPRKPSLCGQISDENGQPLPKVTVFAAPSANRDNNTSLEAYADSNSSGAAAESAMVVSLGPPNVNTDDAGNFRFFDLSPGRYYVWTDFMVPTAPAWVRRWTYYPSSPNLDGAQPVKVGFGSDVGCTHNIQMHTPLLFHVRGSVPKDIAHADEEYFDVSLVETNSAAVDGLAQFKNMLVPGEAFDFADVSAGHYSIRITGPYKKLPNQMVATWSGRCPQPRYLLASRALVVHDSDLTDVTMEPIHTLSVTGEIHFEDIPKEWRSFRVEAQSVTLSPADEISSLRGAEMISGPCSPRARLASDGTFVFESVTGGSYQVGLDLVGVQGDALYLKSVALNGKPIEGRLITLKAGQPAKLNMVVSNNGGEVDVQVKPSGPPAEEYRYDEPCRPKMTVMQRAVLIPDSTPVDGSGLVTGGFTQAGYIQIYRVPPGRYHAVAGENFNFHFTMSPSGYSVWSDPKFLRSMSAFGTAVEVAAGQRVKVLVPDATAQIQDLLAKYDEEAALGDHCAASCSYDGFWNGTEAEEAHKP